MKPYAEPKTLIGIVSISLTTQGIILLTDISNYIHWIKDVLVNMKIQTMHHNFIIRDYCY